MSRETDSSSSGPQGRGGAAYPSGTPPYGARPFPSLHPQERPRPAGTPAAPGTPEPDAEPAADEPRTETQLTTRIRINIPGSRPIPPVVVRTPVEEPPAVDEPTAQMPLPPEPAPEPEPGPEKTSDWFAPRKPVPAPPPAEPGPADQSMPGPGVPGLPGQGADPFGPPASGAHAAPPGFGGGVPGVPPGVDPFTDRPYADPDRPYTDPDTGRTPYLPPPVGSPLDGGGLGRGPQDTPAGGFPSPFPGGTDTPFGTEGRTAVPPFGTEDFPPGVPRPTDPFPGPQDPAFGGGPVHPGGPGGLPGLGGPPAAPRADEPFPGYQPPAGPTTAATGAMMPPAGTAQAPDFTQPLEFGPPIEERVSGDTLVSGIPRVPSSEARPPAPAPAPVPAPRPAAAAPAKRKGRSKLVLLVVAAGAVAVLTYGTGLLMDHSDVPKGTTVLGVDIGDKSKDEAVKTLNDVLGDRTTAPLTLTVGGRKQSLKPSVAGLSVDTDATVRKVAHTDYNPVSVVGSLFGGTRKADPVVLVDEDKLKVALQSVAGRNSAATDGMVRFADGKAIAVPGKPGTTFDVAAAANQVAAAYRTRAETGVDRPIALQVTSAPPKVSQAELTKAVNGFGKTAMSDYVTVRAGGHEIRFGPNKSLPKFLTMLPTPDGTLAPHIDLNVLKGLYGRTYNGVLLERADGSRTPVTPQDVATALIPALEATSPAGRTVTLPNVAK